MMTTPTGRGFQLAIKKDMSLGIFFTITVQRYRACLAGWWYYWLFISPTT